MSIQRVPKRLLQHVADGGADQRQHGARGLDIAGRRGFSRAWFDAQRGGGTIWRSSSAAATIVASAISAVAVGAAGALGSRGIVGPAAEAC